MRPYSNPVWVPNDGAAVALRRIAFEKTTDSAHAFDERWLQTLIHTHLNRAGNLGGYFI
jgi:hypothetical protein